jgi:hypothetical protein
VFLPGRSSPTVVGEGLVLLHHDLATDVVSDRAWANASADSAFKQDRPAMVAPELSACPCSLDVVDEGSDSGGLEAEIMRRT